MSKIKKAVKIGGLTVLLTAGAYGAIYSSQIKDSYNLCMLTDEVGRKAMSRNITVGNISDSQNKDIVESIQSIEQRFKDHQTKYGFNIDDQDLNWKDVPTLIGVFGCYKASGGSSIKTGKYLHFLKEQCNSGNSFTP